jgi:hypothetical protein
MDWNADEPVKKNPMLWIEMLCVFPFVEDPYNPIPVIEDEEALRRLHIVHKRMAMELRLNHYKNVPLQEMFSYEIEI